MKENETIVEFLRLDDVLPALKEAAEQVKKLPGVRRVGYFGSFARNDQVPGSDIDILIELEKDDRHWSDRIPDFLSYFGGVGCPVEVFPFTSEELSRKDNQFYQQILEELIDINT